MSKSGAELERLRRHKSGRVVRGVRTAGSIVLVFVACLVSIAAVVAVWADEQVEDTDRYIATVGPLARDPAVQRAVSDRVTSAITERIDMQSVTDALANTLTENGLPPGIADQLRRLSGPLEEGVEEFVRDEVDTVVRSDAFADVWVTANRQAHAAMVKALTGQGNEAIDVDDGTIRLQLGPLVSNVQQRLVDQGFSLAQAIPEVDKSIVLVQSEELDEVRGYVELLHAAGWWLPPIALALAALGVWLAPNSRRAVLGVGLGVLAAMVLLAVALTIGRRIYLDRLPGSVDGAAAAAVFDALVRFLRESAGTLGVLGAVTALAALLFGPSRPAVAVRRGASVLLGRVGRTAADAGVRTGAVGSWIAERRHALYIGVVALGGVWLLLWNHPTPGSVVLVAAVVLLVLVLLEIAAAASRGAPEAPATWTAEDMESRTTGRTWPRNPPT
ncbi:hypothetical protein [Yinghuangia sp. YIM S10712]|uniref:hypothetical protein n=1 Tax=Yinghuangia sp. YIM S10712 TaxID=3436930 RepID=UPI003F53ABF4